MTDKYILIKYMRVQSDCEGQNVVTVIRMNLEGQRNTPRMTSCGGSEEWPPLSRGRPGNGRHIVSGQGTRQCSAAEGIPSQLKEVSECSHCTDTG